MLCPALLQPLASPPRAVGRCFPGEVQRFVLAGRRFLTLRRGAELGIPGTISLDPFLSCRAVNQTSASPYSPRRVEDLEAWEWTLGSPAATSSSARGAAAVFQGALGAWQPCLCPGHVPSLPHLVLLLFLCSFSWHGWTPGSHHSGWSSQKSLTWCKKNRCHLPMGLTLDLPLPCQPQGELERAGMGWPCLAHPVLCHLVLEQQGVENCWLWGPG